MSDVMTAEIQRRIHNLRAELDELSNQLLTQNRDQSKHRDVFAERPECSDPVQADRSGDSEVDHARSLRTLRDLMWQGRWGLAYHLAQALESQGVPMVEFPSATIRTWALVARAERRPSLEARSLSLNLAGHGDSPEAAPLARRLFDWAALIGLLRSVDPSDVRSCAATFLPPAEMPETTAWWLEYVETLATASRPTTRWMQLPEHEQVSTEIDALMIRNSTEPVRLAASCLMMSVRNAMRHVQVVAVADERSILDAELSRLLAIELGPDSAVATSAADIEQAICNLSPETNPGRATVVSEANPTASPDSTAVDRAPGQTQLELPMAAATPRAQLAISRLDAVEESLQSAVRDEASPALPLKDAQRKARREAARARLQRYSERLASRNSDPPLISLPFQPIVAGDAATAGPRQSSASPGEASTRIAMGEPAGDGPFRSEPASRAADGLRAERPAAGFDPRMSQLREIHAASLASAFGTDASGPASRPSAGSHRSMERDSLWGVLMNPQVAIVAGLLLIAGAVVAGLGTGLRARTLVETAAAANAPPGEESVEFTGDLPGVE